jgi:hypothetical protein
MSDQNKVIGICPVKMRRLVTAMIHGFLNDERYRTRIFPNSPTAVLIPVTRAKIKEEGLMQQPGTNVYIPTRG